MISVIGLMNKGNNLILFCMFYCSVYEVNIIMDYGLFFENQLHGILFVSNVTLSVLKQYFAYKLELCPLKQSLDDVFFKFF